jgi:transcriptional regulator GlxA family with amidase domain
VPLAEAEPTKAQCLDLLNVGSTSAEHLAGMSHPRLAKALVAIHEAPHKPWSLDQLATKAGMSRSHWKVAVP